MSKDSDNPNKKIEHLENLIKRKLWKVTGSKVDIQKIKRLGTAQKSEDDRF